MKVLDKIDLKNVLFLDIETSTTVSELQLDTPLFDSWEYKKRRNGETDKELIDMYATEAALYPEFGRIVCISVGMLSKKGFQTKTFNNLREDKLISEFYAMLESVKSTIKLCGHAIKQFDIPYIAQRGYVHNLRPHPLMDTSGEKPWTMDWILDTKELWQGTSFNRSSLLGISTVLGLPSPKQDLQGKDVPKYFWKDPENNIQRISEYCERDVVATYEVFKHLKNLGEEKEKGLIEKLAEGQPYGKDEKSKLLGVLKGMDKDEQEKAFVVLNSIVSRTKQLKTNITKAHIKTLKEEISKL